MYIGYYGFSGKPFQLSPDPRFFFGSSGTAGRWPICGHGLSRSRLNVITGGIRTGKTTLVKSLFGELDARQGSPRNR